MIWPTPHWLGALDQVLGREDDDNLTLTLWMAGTFIPAVWPHYCSRWPF